MKTVGIQIEGSDAIIVVLEQNVSGLAVTRESCKCPLPDIKSAREAKRFRTLIKTTIDAISPDRIAISRRGAKPNSHIRYTPSAPSFKIEGIIQTYEDRDIETVSPKTASAFLKDKPMQVEPRYKYQQQALELAYYLMMKG